MNRSTKTEKKMWAGVLMVILLTICLAFTTYALVTVTYVVKDNATYSTGTISINLNDEKPIISEADGFLFEPGVLVEKEFFIRNTGTGDAYYRLYFDAVDDADSGLADVMEITVTNPGNSHRASEDCSVHSGVDRGERKYTGTVLYKGTMTQLQEKQIANDELAPGECRHLYMYFKFPEELGNKYMEKRLSFDVKAEAIQKKNNPNRTFGPLD